VRRDRRGAQDDSGGSLGVRRVAWSALWNALPGIEAQAKKAHPLTRVRTNRGVRGGGNAETPLRVGGIEPFVKAGFGFVA